MSLSVAEIESVRFHLGWGNISAGASPYSSDGFLDVFNGIVGPYLTTSTEATAAQAIASKTTAVVTPSVMTLIVLGCQLVCDVGDAAEIVMVKAVSPTTFTASFVKAHDVTGWPVLVMCGKARLRYLLHSAETVWARMQGTAVSGSLGIKQLGQGEIEWFSASAVYQSLAGQYLGIVNAISQLLHVPMNDALRAPSRALEAY